MLLKQFKIETAKEVWKEEAATKGMAEGVESVISFLKQGLTIEEVEAKFLTLN